MNRTPARPARNHGAARLRALAATLLLANAAFAGCGLGACPRQERPEDVRTFELGLAASRTSFDIEGISGGYTELMGSAQFRAYRHLAVGLHAPLILLEAGEEAAGVGNVSAFAEYLARPGYFGAIGAGAQVELPTAEADHGLGEDHWMAMGYVRLAKPLGDAVLGAALGTAFALGDDHSQEGDHAGHAGHSGPGTSPVYVHPHEPIELHYRVSAAWRLPRASLLPEAYLDGQRVLGDPAPGGERNFLTAGAAIGWRRGPFLAGPTAAFPLLSDARFSWSAGFTFGYSLALGKSAAGAPGET